VLTLSRGDRVSLRSDFVSAEPRLLKRMLWMRRPDENLLQYLIALPRLGTVVQEYKIARRRDSEHGGWVIGQGFKPAIMTRLPDESYSTTNSLAVTNYPFLKTEAFRVLALPKIDAPVWPDIRVHRAGFTMGFIGPHILIPQGVERDVGRVRAAYTDQSLTFRHSIQAIIFPESDQNRAKLLTAILNSRLTAWFVFHETANLGTDRAKVHQAELLGIPFPSADDLSDRAKAEIVAQRIIDVVDEALASADSPLYSDESYLDEIDRLVYVYFGLSDDEIALVDDTLDYIIPAMQPRESDFPSLWSPCDPDSRKLYAETLKGALGTWLQPNTGIHIALAGLGKDLAALRLRLVTSGAKETGYYETLASETALSEVLNRIWRSLPQSVPGNFQAIPDLRIFLDGDLYMVKPRQLRYWLRSTALADADDIAADLHRISAMNRLEAPRSVC
jgi:hypothetical protein